jgi:CRISPR-associated protein Cas6/Cse3/CasE subtype I-E
MFLSRVAMTASSDYEAHQHLHHLFGERDRCFLWRWDGPGAVAVLSTVRPLPTVPCRAVALDDLPSGKPLAFALRFVAARCKSRPGRIGAKVPIRAMSERRAWLADHLARAGATLRFVSMRDCEIDIKTAQVVGADATGMLVIDERARFAAHLQAGFGRNRAFGCGLIWLPEVMA